MDILLPLAVIVILGACSRETGTSPEPGRPIYTGEARIDPASGSLAADWTIRFVVDSSMAEGVSFLLNERLEIGRLEGAGVESVEERPWRDGSGWSEIDITWEDPASAGEVREIEIGYDGVLFDSIPADPINSIQPDWIELGLDAAWHPVFPSFDQSLVGVLTLHLPGRWTVVASGEVVRERDTYRIRNSTPQVDVAFAAGRDLRADGTDRIAVFHEGTEPAAIDRILEAAGTCRDWLSDRFGSMPDLKFVLAPRDESGYARKNYIVLTRVGEFSDTALSRFVCHELAHFWSSAASPSTPDYWMTEAFAEFVSALHVRDVHGDTAYAPIVEQWREQSEDQPPVWTDTATARPPFRVSYRKAPLLLTRLRTEIGEEEFTAFLRRYMIESTRTTPELLDKLEDVAGREARTRFEALLAE